MLVLGGPAPYVPPARRPPAVIDQRGGLSDGRLEAPIDVYAATQAGMLSPAARRLRPRVYVPDSSRGAVAVIDPRTSQVVRHIAVGLRPRQVVPSWDLKTLWVIESRRLVPIDARTGSVGRAVPVTSPSDLYFSVDGREAFVLDARHGRVQVRDPHTMRLRSTIPMPCQGLTHADFSADGSTLVVGCARARLARVDLVRHRVTGTRRLAATARPRDVRLSPDGSTFYIADAVRGGVWLVDALRLRPAGFIHTGRGARGLYPSRDATVLYVLNGGERTVSLVSFAQHQVVASWRIPAAPDTGGVSADGRVLWVSAPAGGAVFAMSTATGRLLHTVTGAADPHGLCVHPQPGRFSLGHTGNYR